jgi:endoglycosylceramidase
MDLARTGPGRPHSGGRWPTIRVLASALILFACAACRLAGLPGIEPTVAVRPKSMGPAVLRVEGRHFVDRSGRVVLIRGINIGSGKLPPFVAMEDPAILDRVAELGFSAIRLPFIWEAFEPEPGRYDTAYMARMTAIAAAAWDRGLFTIVDIHQDGFSRNMTRGCGSGFPLWAISPRATPHAPDNGCDCRTWALQELTDPNMHRSFSDFYADHYGVRTRYLAMLGQVASAFAAIPGVIGYDPLNEPWGDERREIMPLYRDAAKALRARHPAAILFLEAHGPTAAGARTRLPYPGLDNIAFAPHYYKPLAIALEDWRGQTATINLAFERMEAKAAEWGVPLILGEIGIQGGARRAGDYVEYLYGRLDATLSSALQWNVAPHWTPQSGDGWNGEDFSILDGTGRTRANYRPRPYPSRVAGMPISFRFDASTPPRGCPRLEFVWEHRPGIGPTEIVVPAGAFPPGSRASVESADATCQWDPTRRLLTCDAPRPMTIRVVIDVP